MMIPIPTCALAAGLLLASCQAQVAAADCPVAGTETATVADVLDGDTLRLADGVILRLAGVEAPKSPPADEISPAMAAAVDGLRQLARGATVGLTPTGEGPDRHGRRHGYVFLADGRSVHAAMVAAGLARVRWLPGESACFGAFLAEERVARAARRGLWARPEYAIRRADDPSLGKRNGLYDLIEGRIVSVGHGTRMIFLDFGRNFRQDFTVMVPPPVAEGLAAAGRSADGFADRRVLVRGIIEEAGGPAIRLNDPAEIEFVDDDDQDDAGPQR
jgi:endonuclease YncB( thermonuclease family)